MCVYKSTRKYEDFFEVDSWKKYQKYSKDTKTKIVFEWLQARIDWLISSTYNHKKPALQGVICNLEEEIFKKTPFNWTSRDTLSNDDKFFITMIGAMVHFLLGEFGYSVEKNNIRLTNNSIITTASKYKK